MKNRAIVLLSGEPTSIPLAEVKALFLAKDPGAAFIDVDRHVVQVDSVADPLEIGSRVAFARRVGVEVGSPEEARSMLTGRRARVRTFDVVPGLPPADEGSYLDGIEVRVDLKTPEAELTVIRGEKTRFALTDPSSMRQGWSLRRPRKRAFFHPSAIFPKLSRALVNLSRCGPGDTFLDPFCGTGSLAIEAAEVGALSLASDLSGRMAAGALANMVHFSQSWLGVLRADAFHLPLKGVNAIATDVPYGRAASTGGMSQEGLLGEALDVLPGLLAPGARLVVMHSQANPVGPTSELALEEEHTLYVHKLLTRTISVLRRR